MLLSKAYNCRIHEAIHLKEANNIDYMDNIISMYNVHIIPHNELFKVQGSFIRHILNYTGYNQ